MPRVAILAASVLLTLSVAGCGAAPLGPEGEAAELELVDARLTPERDRVILRFDAELAEPEGVTAEDFRLSRASTVVNYPVGDPQMKEELSVYEDWVTTGYIGGGVVSTDPVELATVELGPGPDELSLRFAEPIDESACEWLAAQQADAHPTEEAGLFPHYEPGQSPCAASTAIRSGPSAPPGSNSTARPWPRRACAGPASRLRSASPAPSRVGRTWTAPAKRRKRGVGWPPSLLRPGARAARQPSVHAAVGSWP